MLTILFAEDPGKGSTLIFDEPEISLHPWPLAILGEAFRLAAEQQNTQILAATHSPVLLSQFAPEHILAAQVDDGQTGLRRLSEIDELKELLEEYAVGALYMAGELAPQGGARAELAPDSEPGDKA